MGLRVCIARKLPGAAPLLVQGPTRGRVCRTAASVCTGAFAIVLGLFQAPFLPSLPRGESGRFPALFHPACHATRAHGVNTDLHTHGNLTNDC